jgi:hypothetical protein
MSSDRIPKNSKGKVKNWKTSEMMEGFCFVISTTGLNRSNTVKDDDSGGAADDDDKESSYCLMTVVFPQQ